jgi:excinuclease ABC subunit C
MLDNSGEVIYVGKAKNLSKRIASYFSGQRDLKTNQLISNIAEIELTITRNEEEALLLELQLIKKLQPKYNILFKDDKSYPYICISINEEYPQLTFYRGNKKKGGKYYGPYPDVYAAKESVELLQKIFGLRGCNNNFFKDRTRPCLQYQIHRCTGPCVDLVNKQEYLDNVENAKKFLQGKTNQIIDDLIIKMEEASKKLLYEKGAYYKEQIIALRKVQKQQIIVGSNNAVNIDVLGIACEYNNVCIHLLCIRGGHILGSRQYFSAQTAELEEILETFIIQHYSNNDVDKQLPDEIVLAMELPNKLILGSTINKLSGKNLKIIHATKGYKTEWVSMAQISAKEALVTHIEKYNNLQKTFLELANVINFNNSIKRIECFDVSHTQGDTTIGACVVFTPKGALKKEYRRYNLKIKTKGDDYAALAETLERRYSKVVLSKEQLPDLVCIDGGKGQLAIAEKIIRNKFNLLDVQLIGIAKGKSRKIGCETLYLSSSGNKLILAKDSVILHLIQQIRNEAHNFAITGHRSKRIKKVIHSNLENIVGIGPKRRKELLKQFGGFKEICQSTIKEIARVKGIDIELAKRIYYALHKDEYI